MAQGRRRRRNRRRREREPAPRRETRRRRPARRIPVGGVALRVAAMLLVVAVILVCAVIFFKVTDIQVTGSKLYTREQILGASGVALGDSIISIRRTEVAARLTVLLPYIEDVQVERILPGTVTIKVTESDAAFAVGASDGTIWLMNASGKLLEQADLGAADYPKLTGVTAQAPEPGVQINTAQTENLAVALQLLELLEKTELAPRITEIDVAQTYDIVVWYGDLYEIHLGGSDELDYKLRYLLSILDQLDSARGGMIDLTLEEKDVAIFREWEDEFGADEPEEPETGPEPEPEPGTEPETGE